MDGSVAFGDMTESQVVVSLKSAMAFTSATVAVDQTERSTLSLAEQLLHLECGSPCRLPRCVRHPRGRSGFWMVAFHQRPTSCFRTRLPPGDAVQCARLP